MLDISIVIGSFNQKDVLKKVLDSFNNQNHPPDRYEVIVIDSTSTDGTAEMLKAHKVKHHFKYIIQENTGKAAARNRGVKEASSNLIMITDSDMIAHQDIVKTHVEAHKKMSAPACFEGITKNMTKLEWPTSDSNLADYIKKEYKPFARLGWYYFLTGNISFPKTIFESENGFDETFTGYGWEDVELGYRLSKKKIPLYYLKEAINYHYHVITEEEEIERNIDKGKTAQHFLKKHPELKWFLGANPLSVFIYRRINEKGSIYKYFKKKYKKTKSRFAFWFLKEYQYLKGLLDK